MIITQKFVAPKLTEKNYPNTQFFQKSEAIMEKDQSQESFQKFDQFSISFHNGLSEIENTNIIIFRQPRKPKFLRGE